MLIDFAHEATGFPTWHRLFLLWFERETQIALRDPMFRFHYWDWRDPVQHDALFMENRLGKSTNSVVEGIIFQNWPTLCWNDTTKLPGEVCDPTVETDPLRRCPGTACRQSNENWPSYADVNYAIGMKEYDASPFNRYVETSSFRNYMEGFKIDPPELTCERKELCAIDERMNVNVNRKLHNSVSVIIIITKCACLDSSHQLVSFYPLPL